MTMTRRKSKVPDPFYSPPLLFLHNAWTSFFGEGQIRGMKVISQAMRRVIVAGAGILMTIIGCIACGKGKPEYENISSSRSPNGLYVVTSYDIKAPVLGATVADSTRINVREASLPFRHQKSDLIFDAYGRDLYHYRWEGDHKLVIERDNTKMSSGATDRPRIFTMKSSWKDIEIEYVGFDSSEMDGHLPSS